jgi:hypothetical protein
MNLRHSLARSKVRRPFHEYDGDMPPVRDGSRKAARRSPLGRLDPFAARQAALRGGAARRGSSRRAAITRNVAQVKPESKNTPPLTVRCVGYFGRFPFDSRPFEPNSPAPSPRLGCQHGTPEEEPRPRPGQRVSGGRPGSAVPALPISSSFRQLHREALGRPRYDQRHANRDSTYRKARTAHPGRAHATLTRAAQERACLSHA